MIFIQFKFAYYTPLGESITPVADYCPRVTVSACFLFTISNKEKYKHKIVNL